MSARNRQRPAHDAAQQELTELLAQIRACRRCIDQPEGAPLPHEPRPVLRAQRSARIAIAGQAPGTRVHSSGVPFTDPSGDRLRAWMGIGEAEFYDETRVAIVPMGFCFPGLDAAGSDLPPRRECARAWRSQVFANLPALELILLVGGYATGWHLPEAARRPVGETVSRWREIYEADKNGPAFFPLPHPSWRNSGWLKRNPWFEAEALPILRAHVAVLLTSPSGAI